MLVLNSAPRPNQHLMLNPVAVDSAAELALLNLVDCPIYLLRSAFGEGTYFAGLNTQAETLLNLKTWQVFGYSARQLFTGTGGHILHASHVACASDGVSRDFRVQLDLGGELRNFRIVLSSLKSEPTQPNSSKYLVGTLHELEDTNSDREDRAAEISDMLSFAAHDMRTPMLNVRQIACLLRNMPDHNQRLIDALESLAEKSHAHMSRILEHAQAVSSNPVQECVDLQELCSDIVQALDPLRSHKVHCPSVLLKCNRLTVQTVLRNLIDNAFRHGTRDNKAHVHIGLSAPDTKSLTISVRDSGKGFRVPSSVFCSSNRHFGLQAIHRLLRLNGGTIAADNSQNGLGAVVSFTIPGSALTPLEPSQNSF